MHVGGSWMKRSLCSLGTSLYTIDSWALESSVRLNRNSVGYTGMTVGDESKEVGAVVAVHSCPTSRFTSNDLYQSRIISYT